MKKPKEVCRLAMRREGNMWIAYVAALNTMDGAVVIGSIAMAAVIDNPKRKAAFQRMMTDAVAEMIHAQTGQNPNMIENEAPPNERAGNA
jgi:hypothetical protein